MTVTVVDIVAVMIVVWLTAVVVLIMVLVVTNSSVEVAVPLAMSEQTEESCSGDHPVAAEGVVRTSRLATGCVVFTTDVIVVCNSKVEVEVVVVFRVTIAVLVVDKVETGAT